MSRPIRNKLSHIRLAGYKSISTAMPLEMDLEDVNILLGANGAGKSNIISFFRMLSYMMSGRFQQYVEQAGTSAVLLHYGPKRTPEMSGSLRFESETDVDVYHFALSNASPNRLVIGDERFEWKKKNSTKPFRETQLTPNFRESALLEDEKDQSVRAVRQLLAGLKVYQFHDSAPDGFLRQASTVESAHYLQAQGNNLASFLMYLRDRYPAAYRRIVDYVGDVVPQFRDFVLEPVQGYVSLRWVDRSLSDYVFNADQFSDGSIRFIALATLLLQPEETMPDVIIIDEPELGLHPYAITQLCEMLKDASLHAQILVATQSKDVVDAFGPEHIHVVEMDPQERCTTVSRLDQADLHEWLEGYSVSELWDKNVIGGRPV